jgi:hypothetical protein
MKIYKLTLMIGIVTYLSNLTNNKNIISRSCTDLNPKFSKIIKALNDVENELLQNKIGSISMFIDDINDPDNYDIYNKVIQKWNEDTSIFIMPPLNSASEQIKTDMEEIDFSLEINVEFIRNCYISCFTLTDSNYFYDISELAFTNNIIQIGSNIIPCHPITNEDNEIICRLGDKDGEYKWASIDIIKGPDKMNKNNVYCYITNRYLYNSFINQLYQQKENPINKKLYELIKSNIEVCETQQTKLFSVHTSRIDVSTTNINEHVESGNDRYDLNSEAYTSMLKKSRFIITTTIVITAATTIITIAPQILELKDIILQNLNKKKKANENILMHNTIINAGLCVVVYFDNIQITNIPIIQNIINSIADRYYNFEDPEKSPIKFYKLYIDDIIMTEERIRESNPSFNYWMTPVIIIWENGIKKYTSYSTNFEELYPIIDKFIKNK